MKKITGCFAEKDFKTEIACARRSVSMCTNGSSNMIKASEDSRYDSASAIRIAIARAPRAPCESLSGDSVIFPRVICDGRVSSNSS